MKRLAVLGAGSWGTALAIALAPRFEEIRLWARDPAKAREMATMRENRIYLPGFRLPDGIRVSHELADSLAGADVILSVVPSRHLRSVLALAAPYISNKTPVVSATKGIEEETLYRMSEVVAESLGGSGHSPIAVLSGPTFAAEIAAGEPAAVVIASADAALAGQVQQAFATPALRFYSSRDVTGVEIGAALKNVIAIGAGICHGLGLGSNSVAALVTRGLAEITRLALVMNASPGTLSGLAGLGDLVLTATGNLSRNRSVGIRLGQGQQLPQILAATTMVAEGVSTCRAAHRLGRKHGVDLPIIQRMYEVLYEGKDPRMAIKQLMERPLTSE
ncbi:MAG TPA: NAD(P)H-dependent glycerol-3-phosphate dehydrogenase [Bryobacteraceae bacterium]|nr:NAD(P)H-dependent glycerol-3-phosphate dehydrogenase [Bryobacteraceae bacterium]